MSNKKTWQVTIETRGQAGSVDYREGSNSVRFQWEYGAHDIIAFVWGPPSETWDNSYPWAAGRHQEIMIRIANDVIKQKAENCWAEFNFERSSIKIKTK